MASRSIALLLALSVSAPAAAERFDGSWGIEATTARGDCDPLYRYYVEIRDGAVHPRSMMGETQPNPVGRVEPDGRIDSRLGSEDDPVTVKGRMADAAGSGAWSAPARRCFGRWRAFKRS